MELTDILIRPIITEKSLNKAALNWYTFEVLKKADKNLIKKTIEQAFKVKVLAVKTSIVKGKTRRGGKKMMTVRASSWKKAMVLLPSEQKIALFEVPSANEQTGLVKK